MVKTQDGRNGNVILTITDRKGNVVFHETVKPADLETIANRILRSIR